jgi:diaminopimelate decarboxylase
MSKPMSCTSAPDSSSTRRASEESLPVNVPVDVLGEVVRRYGTPAYAYDIGRIRAQVVKLRTHLPPEVEVLYSLKANASLGLCAVLAECGLGADVASAGELATALAAGFVPKRIFMTGPDRSSAVLAKLRSLPDVVISVDSASELRLLAKAEPQHRALLRLRPDFCSYATCAAGPDSRFGLTFEDLPSCRGFLSTSGIRGIGFHVFSGSQILSAEGIIHHLRGGVDLALRAGNLLGLAAEIIDLGGGFGVPYAPEDKEPDLTLIGAELRALAKRAAPARLVLELGRYLVAQSGWYLTTVLAQQTHRGRPAVVVDGGTHQRGDMCGLGLRHKGFAPVVLPLGRSRETHMSEVRLASADPAGSPISDWRSQPTRSKESTVPTDVLGCLSLPGDVPAEARPLPPLLPGDVLAFPNAGAYGLAASPWMFHAHPAPAEVAFDGMNVQPLRLRQAPESVLDGQVHFHQDQ